MKLFSRLSMRTKAMIALTILKFAGSGAFAHDQGVHSRGQNFCSCLLASVNHIHSEDILLVKIDELEISYSALRGEFPDTNLNSLRERIDEVTDKALRGSDLRMVRADIQSIAQDMMALFPAPRPEIEPPSLSDVISDPDAIAPKILYETTQANLRVTFEENVVKDLRRIPRDVYAKLLRSIQKGFVSAHSGSGIYRAPDVHKTFAEVKQVPGITRLLGCLNGGILTLKKLILKKNEGKAGSLATYSSLCR